MKLDLNSLLFNGAGVLILLLSGGYMAFSALQDSSEPTCSLRYPAGVEFGLERSGGGLMSGIELEARAGQRQWGMLDRATVVRVRNAPASLALDVKLSSRSDGIRETGKRNGIGMQWTPIDLRPANAACLRYSVQMAEDFEYGKQGILPGLYGGRGYDTSKPSDGKNGFAARLAWRADRTAEVVAQLPTSNGPDGTPIDGNGLYLPRGQWVSIEQEVVLNTPGKQDGILRLWADGKLKIERKNIEYRRDENLRIDGVLAHIDHGSVQRPMPPARETTLKITPFLMSWQ